MQPSLGAKKPGATAGGFLEFSLRFVVLGVEIVGGDVF